MKDDLPVGEPERDDRIDYAPQFDEEEVDENADLTLRLHSTTDARVWAEEWCKVARVVAVRNLERDDPLIDKGWMIGWFANAIEVGRAAGRIEGAALAVEDVQALLRDNLLSKQDVLRTLDGEA